MTLAQALAAYPNQLIRRSSWPPPQAYNPSIDALNQVDSVASDWVVVVFG